MTSYDDFPSPDRDPAKQLGLKGALASFEGTPLIPLIEKSLTEAGFDPITYDPAAERHANYCGLPVDTLDDSYDSDLVDPRLSPIIEAIEAEADSGTIAYRTVASGTVQFHPWTMYPPKGAAPFEPNAELTSKLSTVGMLKIVEAKSGVVLGYAPELILDGGRPGHVLISTNDVILS